MQQEHRVEWHSKDISNIVVQYKEKRTRPAEQADQLSMPCQPHRAKQDWHSNKEIDHVIGHKGLIQIFRRVYSIAVQKTDNGHEHYENGDEGRENIYQREVTLDWQTHITFSVYVHSIRLLELEEIEQDCTTENSPACAD
jgi:hypothetical protein